MLIYLAARYGRRNELISYAARLRELMYEVASGWLDGQHEIGLDGLSERQPLAVRMQVAHEDMEDLSTCEVLVCFTEPERSTASRGGRHVEYGIALALGKRLLVVGPAENIFHTLADARVDTFEDCLSILAEWCAEGEPACRVCGCTDDRACEGGCWWVEADLCSACVGKEATDGGE